MQQLVIKLYSDDIYYSIPATKIKLGNPISIILWLPNMSTCWF